MKKLGNKGFMLVETLVVATFIMTIATFLYKNAIPLMGEYTMRYNYDDIDSVYAVNLIRNMLLEDTNFNSLTNGIMNGTKSYNDITNCNLWSQQGLCNRLKEQLNIIPSIEGAQSDGRIYVMKFELSKLKEEVEKDITFSNNTDRGIQSYVNYLPKFTTTKVTTGYRIIIIRNVISNGIETQKYANIEVIQ